MKPAINGWLSKVSMNKIHHTDHSRQFLVSLDVLVKEAKRDPKKRQVRRSFMADLITQGVKFLLPGNGILLDDPNLKGINENLRLSLPFPIIVLEFPDPWGDLAKTIITVQEEETKILLYVTMWHTVQKKWGTMSPLLFDRDAYIERDEKGMPDLLYSLGDEVPDELKLHHDVYNPYIVVFLQFMNVLACRNVSCERSPPSKVKQQFRRGPIPFDEYKVLTIGTSGQHTNGSSNHSSDQREVSIHRSPREHLRRGHLVRMGNGTVYWRNSTIVMPGNGGRIDKAYSLK